MKVKKAAERPIFLDESGRRWSKVKSIVFVAVGFVFLAVSIGLLGIFGQPRNLLPRIEDDSNYDVIDNISSKSKEFIIVGGAGTFIKITPDYSAFETSYDINRFGQTEGKIAVITFDDGPDPVYTPRIADILKKENIPASFFVVGEQILKYPMVAKMLVEQGFEIGNHTFSHIPDESTDLGNRANQSQIEYELNFTQNAIISATGMKTKLFRPPYWGAEEKISLNSLVLTTFALDKGYWVSSPTLDSNDWQTQDVAEIVRNSLKGTDGPTVLLFHDGGGNREKTVQALPTIIRFYKEKGYRFVTLSDLAGQKTMVSPSTFEDISSNIAVLSYRFLKSFPSLLNPIFLFGLVFTLIYSSTVVLLSLLELARSSWLKRSLRKNYQPPVTVLVPAYNEEKVIDKTIKSILASDYPDFKIFVIDDGSTDATLKIAKSLEKDPRVVVLHKENGGKFSALNFGLENVQTEIYIAIDADTQVLPNTISRLVRFFQIKKVGAVAGNIKVGNRRNMLGILQSIEYVMNLNLERNAYSFLNSILVVPGALGAWRTSLVRKIGGYSGDTLTEDAELTLRILRTGYRVIYDKDPVAYTEAPATASQLIRQRLRWTFGIFQTLFAHKDLIFKKRQKFLGFVVLPFTVFFQVPIMLTTPLMDLLAVYYFFFISAKTVVIYFSFYLGIRTVLAAFAFGISKEVAWPLILLPLQRVYYQPILYLSLYQAAISVVRGLPVAWKKVEHCGSVSL